MEKLQVHCRYFQVSLRDQFWAPYTFIIYVDSVFLADLSPGTQLALCTDDMLLYRPIRCTQDLVDLQSDTDKIGQ